MNNKNPNTEAAAAVGIPAFYSNHISVQVSMSDFCLSFALLLPKAVAGEGKKEKGGEKATPARMQSVVYLSPVQAKALRDLLDHQVTAYEEKNGKLPATYEIERQ